jgi:hypothetical protein
MNDVTTDAHDVLARGQSRTDRHGSVPEVAPASHRQTGWLADCHVHMHDEFAPEVFLDGAARNLAVAARQIGAGEGSVGCLFLTETRRQGGFDRLQRGGGGWSVQHAAEPVSLIARRGAADVLVVVAGRQVVTRERLEVLLLGSSAELPDGESVERTLERAGETGGLVVLPWGFGKWSFARGRIVERLLSSAAATTLFVGDTGNRTSVLPRPRLLRRARRLGVPVLPGSDPLPLSSHVERAGRCGIFLECVPDLEQPADQIVRLLRGTRVQPQTFGRPEPFVRFAVTQILMQLSRRRGPRSPAGAAA